MGQNELGIGGKSNVSGLKDIRYHWFELLMISTNQLCVQNTYYQLCISYVGDVRSTAL